MNDQSRGGSITDMPASDTHNNEENQARGGMSEAERDRGYRKKSMNAPIPRSPDVEDRWGLTMGVRIR
jgi:hypothetical protein